MCIARCTRLSVFGGIALLLATGALAATAPAPTGAPVDGPASNAQEPVAPTTPKQPDAPKQQPPAPPPSSLPKNPASVSFVEGVIIVIGVIGIAFLLAVFAALRDAKSWSLSDALSETATLPISDPKNAGALMLDATGQPLVASKLVASSSRLIALLGLLGILTLFLGFGVFALYYYGTGQGVPAGITDATTFLLGGATLFAPYAINKVASVFSSSPSK